MNNLIILSKEELEKDIHHFETVFEKDELFEVEKITELKNVFVLVVQFCDTERAYDLIQRLQNSAKEFITFELSTGEKVQLVGVEEHHDFMDEMLEKTSTYAEWEDQYENDSLFDDLTRQSDFDWEEEEEEKEEHPSKKSCRLDIRNWFKKWFG
jgi:hypothetical protein